MNLLDQIKTQSNLVNLRNASLCFPQLSGHLCIMLLKPKLVPFKNMKLHEIIPYGFDSTNLLNLWENKFFNMHVIKRFDLMFCHEVRGISYRGV